MVCDFCTKIDKNMNVYENNVMKSNKTKSIIAYTDVSVQDMLRLGKMYLWYL